MRSALSYTALKSHKRKVLDDIQDRLLLDAKMPSVQDIDAQTARYEELKSSLNEYVALINRTWGATGQTLHRSSPGRHATASDWGD